MDFTTTTLTAAAKAMEDVVLPALIANGERQAVEQAHLAWDAIKFARDRVELVDERRRREVIEFIDLLDAILAEESVIGESIARARTVRDEARAVLADPTVGAVGYAATLATLGESVTDALLDVDALDPTLRNRVETAVLDRAIAQLELDRSWLLPMGFDPDPATVKPLSEALAS